MLTSGRLGSGSQPPHEPTPIPLPGLADSRKPKLLKLEMIESDAHFAAATASSVRPAPS